MKVVRSMKYLAHLQRRKLLADHVHHLAITLESAGGQLVLQDRTISVTRLSGEVDLGEDDAEITDVVFDAEGANLTLSGAVRQFADPQADLVYKATVEAARASTMRSAEIFDALPDAYAAVKTLNALYMSLAAVPTSNHPRRASAR